MNINITLVAQMLAFATFVWFTMKFVWPPLTQAMEERQKKIAEGLAAADRAEQDFELAQKKAADVIKEAKQQAASVLEQANKRANELVEEAKDTAKAEGERLLASAQAKIEQEAAQARNELRQTVATLAVSGAEKILKKEIDAKAHSDLLDDLAAQL